MTLLARVRRDDWSRDCNLDTVSSTLHTATLCNLKHFYIDVIEMYLRLTVTYSFSEME